MELREGPHDADGFYTCSCGTDRDGRPYNRSSVVHAHRVLPAEGPDVGLDADGTMWQVVEDGPPPPAGGLRYRVRKREPVDRATYQQRLREQVEHLQREYGSRVGQRVPAPEPLPEVLTWTATRLDREPPA